jgi:hypothetical protein
MDILIYFFLLIIFLLVFGTMVWASLSGAPWLPSWKKDIRAVLREIDFKPTDVIYDLGSGDGRWLLEVAKYYKVKKIIGYEISFLFYFWSRIKILFSGYPQIQVKFKDLFKADFAQADIIFCFLLPKTIAKLKSKFESEMKPGSLLVSYTFKLHDHNPEKIVKISQNSLPIYLYRF